MKTITYSEAAEAFSISPYIYHVATPELKPEDVDSRMYPILKSINASQWVVTLFSCQHKGAYICMATKEVAQLLDCWNSAYGDTIVKSHNKIPSPATVKYWNGIYQVSIYAPEVELDSKIRLFRTLGLYIKKTRRF